jgi:N utilization substance protein A
VVVPDEQLSLAIGRRGQNVRLASQLIGWNIDIMTEAEESERRQTEFRTRSTLFMEALDVDEVIAHLLVVEGFTSIEDVVETSDSEIARIEGFDEDVAAELKNRARGYLETKRVEFEKRCKELGVSTDLARTEGLNPDMILKLAEQGVKTVDDLGDLAADELREMVGADQLTESQANGVIMKARESWFPAEETQAASG